MATMASIAAAAKSFTGVITILRYPPRKPGLLAGSGDIPRAIPATILRVDWAENCGKLATAHNFWPFGGA
jgi:hypothetical protein